MKIIYLNKNSFSTEYKNPSVLALGFFDGIHIGHKRLIMKAQEIAKEKSLKLAVMTFHPHPKEVIRGEQFDYLMTLEAKAEKMKELGVDALYIVNFTKEFAKLSPEMFVMNYINELNVQHVVGGFDYSYGYKGQGTMSTIRSHGNEQFDVTVLPKVEVEGRKISSTHIRDLLAKGEVKQVKSFMGSEYETVGRTAATCCKSVMELLPSHACMIPGKGKYRVAIQFAHTIEYTSAEVCVGRNGEKNIKIELHNSSELRYNNREIYVKWLVQSNYVENKAVKKQVNKDFVLSI